MTDAPLHWTMIDAPLYENTPWERLGPIAIWVGLAGLATGVFLRRVLRRRTDASVVEIQLASLRALSAALATVGLPFALLWSRAHDTSPYAFGRVMVFVGVTFGVQAMVVGVARRRDPRWRWAFAYGLLTTSTCAAVAVAAFSRRIIAEGQVTAMVAAVGFLFAGVTASLVEATIVGIGHPSPTVRRAWTFFTLVGLATLVAWRLPIVQFVDRDRVDAIHPIHGGLFAYLAGLMAGLLAFKGSESLKNDAERHHSSTTWWACAVAVAFVTAALSGYLLQAWLGAAIAMLGISVALVLSHD